MSRHVWLCTRPLSYATKIPQLETVSDGRPYLRHWGVLITNLTIVDMKVFNQLVNSGTSSLGTMYELQRGDNEQIDVLIDCEFSLETIRKHWGSFDAQYVGETQFTHDMIKDEAVRIIKDRPTYRLFENNCQNFATFLLETLCPGSRVPDTIQMVIDRLLQFIQSPPTLIRLPGAYPPSMTDSEAASYLTATEMSQTTWWTASRTSWITAIEHSVSFPAGWDQSSTIASFLQDEQAKLSENRRNPLKALTKFLQRRELRKQFVKDREELFNITGTDFEQLNKLLERGVNLSLKDGQGWTALHISVFQNAEAKVRLLLDAGADVSAKNHEMNTPLHVAYMTDFPNEQVVEHLLTAAADPLARNNLGNTPLHIAALHDNISNRNEKCGFPVKVLLNFAKSINVDLVNAENDEGKTPLFLMLEKGISYEDVKFLLDAGADPCFISLFDETLIHAHFKRLHEIWCERDRYNETSYVLVWNQWRSVLRKLVDSGVDLSVKSIPSSQTVLHLAAHYHDLETLEILLSGKNVDPSSKTATGRTPLHIVIKSGWEPYPDKAVELLIAAGANVHAGDKYGELPLHLACSTTRFSLSVVMALLAAGSQVVVEDHNRRAPIDILMDRVADESTSDYRYEQYLELLYLFYHVEKDLVLLRYPSIVRLMRGKFEERRRSGAVRYL